MDAIILCGGLGTRLKSVISDIPKPLAPVNGKPFLEYVMDFLNRQNIAKVVFSVGYMAGKVKDHFNYGYKNIVITYSVETEPLGTGGAIKKALNLTESKDILILNGDTFFNIDLIGMMDFHTLNNSELTLALKKSDNTDRYGTVKIDKGSKIINFQEKHYKKCGYINGGIYIIKKGIFEKFNTEEKFSFEKDFIEKYFNKINLFGYISNGYFIDIGIPEDYEKAKNELVKISL
ncbi:MAG: nucleotidyltransferase family protein [bacterium]